MLSRVRDSSLLKRDQLMRVNALISRPFLANVNDLRLVKLPSKIYRFNVLEGI